MVKIYKKTELYCPTCHSELQLVEETYYNDFDGEILKDVEHYFECEKNCDSPEDFLIVDKDKHIERIILEGNDG